MTATLRSRALLQKFLICWKDSNFCLEHMSDWETYFLSSERTHSKTQPGKVFRTFPIRTQKRAQMMKNESLRSSWSESEKKLKWEQKNKKKKRIVNSTAGRAFNQTDFSQSGKTVIKSTRSCTGAAQQGGGGESSRNCDGDTAPMVWWRWDQLFYPAGVLLLQKDFLLHQRVTSNFVCFLWNILFTITIGLFDKLFVGFSVFHKCNKRGNFNTSCIYN